MRVREVESTLKLSILKKGKTEQEEKDNWNNKRIQNSVSVIAGTVGSGKTTLNYTKTGIFKDINATCIRVTEKESNPQEVLSMMLPVKEKYHLDALKAQHQEPMTRKELDQLVKIWHPVILPDLNDDEGKDLYNIIYRKKHYPINWFTLPVKIPKEVLIAILRASPNSDTVSVCEEVIKKLKPEEDLWDMIDQVSTKIMSKDYSVHYDPKYMVADVGMIGNKRTVENIATNFLIFNEYYCFQPQGFEIEYDTGVGIKVVKNLTLQTFADEILNDNKHIHQISMAYYSDERARYALLIDILILIRECLKRNLAKYPIYISLDELYNVLPKISKDKEAIWMLELSKLIAKIFRQFRNSGKGVTVDLFTQDYFKTDTSAISSGSSTLIMRISLEDKKIFIRDLQYNRERMLLIDGLQIGELVILEELEEHEGTKYLAAMPRFRVPEEFENQLEEFKKEYPERMENYGDLYKKLINHRKEVHKKSKKRMLEKIESRKKEEQKKKEDKEGNIKEGIEKKMREEKTRDEQLESKDKRKEECYNLRKAGMPFEKIVIKLGLSNPSVRKYCYSYAVEIEDKEFLEKEGKAYLLDK